MVDDFSEIKVCPFCDSGAHKLLHFADSLYCKACSKSFFIEEKKLNCHKCKGGELELSDFPMPDGEFVFQCKKCKKMFSGKEVFSSVKDSLEI